MEPLAHAVRTGTPPSLSFAGELHGAPRKYAHGKCGGQTEMPEELIRGYLADPFFFLNETQLWCATCARHVSLRDVVWVETGQSVAAYIDDLRAATLAPGGANYRPADPIGILALLFLLAAPVAGGLAWGGAGAAIGVAAGVAAVGTWTAYRRFRPLVSHVPPDE